MSTALQPLKYLWSAVFMDGHLIDQNPDDRYSKHDNTADWNPSAFRDIQEYKNAPLRHFHLISKTAIYIVSLDTGEFTIDRRTFSLEDEPLINRKLIYYREMQQDWQLGQEAGDPQVNRYVMGYEGRDTSGKVIKKVIYIHG